MCTSFYALMSLTSLCFLINLSEALPTSKDGKYYLHGSYTAAFDPFSQHVFTLSDTNKECKNLCDRDNNCNGYSIDGGDNCYLSSCDENVDVASCSSCKFASKVSPSSSPVCTSKTTTADTTTTDSEETTAADTTTTDSEETTAADTTTIDSGETTVADITTIDSEDTMSTDIGMSLTFSTEMSTGHSAITSATPIVQSTGNTSCVCVCEDVDITIEESIIKRKRELVIDKKELSSSIRKLTSATDHRMSSRTIGFIGILLIAVFGLFLFGTDISSALFFLYQKFKN